MLRYLPCQTIHRYHRARSGEFQSNLEMSQGIHHYIVNWQMVHPSGSSCFFFWLPPYVCIHWRYDGLEYSIVSSSWPFISCACNFITPFSLFLFRKPSWWILAVSGSYIYLSRTRGEALCTTFISIGYLLICSQPLQWCGAYCIPSRIICGMRPRMPCHRLSQMAYCGHNVCSLLTLLVICHDALTIYWDHSWIALIAFTLADPARC